LNRTPLDALHRERGGRMVPFAGYELPVHYPTGIMGEHLHTRAEAGLFDVSHMGQLRLHGEQAAAALESLVPGDITHLAPGRIRYTVFTNDAGGILDDLMVTNAGDHLFLVVNAACKAQDLVHLQAGLAGRGVTIEPLFDRGLLALQGPNAVMALARLQPAVAAMPFMTSLTTEILGRPAIISRSGYTGEDGYELSLAAGDTEAVARALLAEPEVAPIGLGARDSLRLEAGLCLYGHDLDPTTTPIEGNLAWIINRRRRTEGGFPGAAVIQAQLRDGPPRLRVGVRPDGRAPAREHTEIRDQAGRSVGVVTSGGFAPSLKAPIAMGYVDAANANPGTALTLIVRGKELPARVVPLPFVAHGYAR